ncbi:hypothetical protein [Microbacterium sp.]|uniref:hypothetical protein n=1 Tax=Microbacterium sp. TaxID=51671 RepID=UPI0028124B9A|nr:hypothetical protein [Microbacterium sp.]
MRPQVFDVSVLRAPVDPAVAKHASHERVVKEGRGVGVAAGSAWAIIQSLVLVVGAGLLAGLCVVAVQYMFGADGADGTTVILAALMVTPLAVARVRSHISGPREQQAEEYRLTSFAAANGLSYSTGQLDPVRPATVFGQGTSRVVTDVLTGTSPRAFEFGNYSYDIWSAKTRLPQRVSYAALELRSPLPSMTLKSRSREHPTGTWEPAPALKRLSVDAEFDARFDVYCASEVTEAVREVLTGPGRDALLAVGAYADVEIVDGRLYVVAGRHLRLSDPGFWEWAEDLLALADALDGPAAPAGHGTDASVPDAGTADAGRGARRTELFAPPKVGRPVAIGCLLPLLIGLAAAAVITMIGLG